MSTKAWLAVTSLCASALISFSTSSFAETELPKEGPVAAMGIFHSSLKVIAVGDLMLAIEGGGTSCASSP